jgi:hypothetical protein
MKTGLKPTQSSQRSAPETPGRDAVPRLTQIPGRKAVDNGDKIPIRTRSEL